MTELENWYQRADSTRNLLVEQRLQLSQFQVHDRVVLEALQLLLERELEIVRVELYNKARADAERHHG